MGKIHHQVSPHMLAKHGAAPIVVTFAHSSVSRWMEIGRNGHKVWQPTKMWWAVRPIDPDHYFSRLKHLRSASSATFGGVPC